jgi:hypothetical protein
VSSGSGQGCVSISKGSGSCLSAAASAAAVAMLRRSDDTRLLDSEIRDRAASGKFVNPGRQQQGIPQQRRWLLAMQLSGTCRQ